MPVRYHLRDEDGSDLGPFISDERAWSIGDKLFYRQDYWVIEEIVEPAESVNVRSVFVIRRLTDS